MLKAICIGVICLIGFRCFAGDYRQFTVTTHSQTSSVAMTKWADSFSGEIDEIAVYTVSGVTGAVAVAIYDPISSNAITIATNSAVTDYMVWRPRIIAPDVGGATSLAVTNTSTADRFRVQGESLRAIVSGASATSQVFTIRIKIK